MKAVPLKRPPTAEEYETAIQRTEKAFARNKTRMWVLKCLRDELRRAVNSDPDVDIEL